jgi:transketolase
MKDSMRLSALMGLPVTYILTHDSIGVGEDGPTHQPIEQLVAARSIPNFTVFRPCDSRECAVGWYLAMTKKDGPVGLILTRQGLPLLPETGKDALKGAYILKDTEKPDVLLMASGSEVELVYKAADVLAEKGIKARVISVPSMELFDKQSCEYKQQVMPSCVRARVAIEAGSTMCWYKYVGLDGYVIGLDHFGASAPAEKLFVKFGITVENVVEKALKSIEKVKGCCK